MAEKSETKMEKFWTLVVTFSVKGTPKSPRNFSVRGLEYVMLPHMRKEVIEEVESTGTAVGPKRVRQMLEILRKTEHKNPLEESGKYHLGHQIRRAQGYARKMEGSIFLRAVPASEFEEEASL
jgi:hypothetical protein